MRLICGWALLVVASTAHAQTSNAAFRRFENRNVRPVMGRDSVGRLAVPEVVQERNTSPSWDRTPRGGRARRAALSALPESWMPEAEESQDAPRYVQGERVRHRKFGGGVVRAVAGQGKGLKVTVEFDDQDIGTKQLLVAYAGLERDWEGGAESP